MGRPATAWLRSSVLPKPSDAQEAPAQEKEVERCNCTHCDWREEAIRLTSDLAARDRHIETLTQRLQRLETTRKIIHLPKDDALPTTRIGLDGLRDTAEKWAEQGKSGWQPFNMGVFAKQLGTDRRTASAVTKEAVGMLLVHNHEYDNGKKGQANAAAQRPLRWYEASDR